MTDTREAFRLPVANRYFISLSRQGNLCPRCGRPVRYAGSLDPDGAYEVCDHCGWVTTITAPDWACVGRAAERPTRPAKAGPHKSHPPYLRLVK